MKTYLVFWTFVANYSDKFSRLNVYENESLAEKIHLRFDHYRDDFKKSAKLHIVEVGGDVVFEGAYSDLTEHLDQRK